jgi:hypothetical protein
LLLFILAFRIASSFAAKFLARQNSIAVAGEEHLLLA